MPFLLERLASRPIGLDGREEAFDETAAIQAQVQRIFYTRNRQDGGAILSWGLTHPVDIGRSNTLSLERYAEQARRAIVANEPRLKDVRVMVLSKPDASNAALQITARLADSGEECSFEVNTG
jgi:predicted component of type VI protein secretion system